MAKSKQQSVSFHFFIIISLICIFLLGYSISFSLKEVQQRENLKSISIDSIEHEDFSMILFSLNNLDKMEKENTASIMKSLETLANDKEREQRSSLFIMIILLVQLFFGFFLFFSLRDEIVEIRKHLKSTEVNSTKVEEKSCS